MKKNFKYFLMGAGAVVAGFFAYAWLKDQPKEQPEDIIAEPPVDAAPPRTSAEQHISQEYIEHRRELYRKRAAQRTTSPTAAEDSSASPVTAHETPAQAAQEAPVKKAEKPDDPAQDGKESIGPDHNDEPPADCPEKDGAAPAETSGEGAGPDETDRCADADEGTDEAGEGGDMDEDPGENEGQEESEEARKK